MKKYSRFAILTVLVLALGCIGTANAIVIPPQGVGQIGISAVVMLNDLPVYAAPDASSKVLMTLETGRHVIVLEQADGWAKFTLSDSVDETFEGWADADSLLIDNAWYFTGEETLVYAWNDTEAPVFEIFEEGTLLPILKDDGEWLVVSLNGASAWILKTEADMQPFGMDE